MKDTPPPPPDMSCEQSRELKALRAREARLQRQIDSAAFATARRLTRLDREIENGCHRIRNAHRRAANRECKELAAPLRAEQRQARTLSHRLTQGRTPEQRERAAISKRIAILEGRLGS